MNVLRSLGIVRPDLRRSSSPPSIGAALGLWTRASAWTASVNIGCSARSMPTSWPARHSRPRPLNLQGRPTRPSTLDDARKSNRRRGHLATALRRHGGPLAKISAVLLISYQRIIAANACTSWRQSPGGGQSAGRLLAHKSCFGTLEFRQHVSLAPPRGQPRGGPFPAAWRTGPPCRFHVIPTAGANFRRHPRVLSRQHCPDREASALIVRVDRLESGQRGWQGIVWRIHARAVS